MTRLLEQPNGLDQLLFCVNNYKNKDPVRGASGRSVHGWCVPGVTTQRLRQR